MRTRVKIVSSAEVTPQEVGITSVLNTPAQVKHLSHPLLRTPPQEEGIAPHS